MNHPGAQVFMKSIQRELEKAHLPKHYTNCLRRIFDFLLQLDAGMINGQVVPSETRDTAYVDVLQLGREAFEGLASANPKQAQEWLDGRPVWARPRGVDFTSWRSSIRVPAKVAPLDLDATPMHEDLRRQLKALTSLAQRDPARHLLHPPASMEEIHQRELELGVRLPEDLKLLYRLWNGFALFRREGSYDAEGSPFRLVPLYNLQTYREASGGDTGPQEIPPKTLAELLTDPDRLQVFDLGNGSFLSWSRATDGQSVWIDDFREGPRGIVSSSVAEILKMAFSQDLP